MLFLAFHFIADTVRTFLACLQRIWLIITSFIGSRDFYLLLGFVGLAFSVYVTALNAPFIWDDEVIIQANPILHGTVSVLEAFNRSVFGHEGAFMGFYRPLQIWSYWIDVQLWGSISAFGMRITSVLLHASTGFFLFFVFRRLLFSYWVSSFLAMLYTVHPLCIEAVTYLSGRGDALGMLAFVTGVFFWLRGGQGHDRFYLFAASGVYILSLFIKENGVLLPLVFLAIIYQQGDSFGYRKLAIRMASILLLIGAAYSLFVVLRVSGHDTQAYSWLAVAPVWQRIATVPLSLWTYLKLTVAPISLHMEYHFVAETVWLSLGAGLALLGCIIWVYRCLPRSRFCLWFAFILAGWLPVNGVYPRLASTIREHWWMIPLVGILGLLGDALMHLIAANQSTYRKSSRLIGIVAMCFLVFLGTMTVFRNQDWRDPLYFYSHDLSLEPRSFLLYNNLGVIMHTQGKYKEAGLLFAESIRQSPQERYSVAYNNYGAVLEHFGHIESAIRYYQESVRLTGYHVAQRNLRRLTQSRHKPKKQQ